MPVDYKVVLVPDMLGNRVCEDCGGYGWNHGYRDDGEPGRIECGPCDGNGHFREETDIIPVEDGYPLQSPKLSRDDFGRYIHITCNGGGIGFFEQCGLRYWSCTSCREWGLLSHPEWKSLQRQGKQSNLLANARGAELLLKLRASL